jgi:predicted GIY-YIG superfamily endonuclease
MILAVLLMTLAAGLLVAVGVAIVRGETPVPPPLPVPVRRPVRTEVPHLLYYYLHATQPGKIYWGISNCPEAREAQHVTDPDDQWWMRQSTGVMYYHRWYPNRRAALAAERAAIRASAYAGEQIANQVHHPAGRSRRAVH